MAESDPNSATILTRNGNTVTFRVPMAFVRRGGRKAIVASDGSTDSPGVITPRSRIDNTMIKALARAFRWQRLLDSGEYGSIAELADAENLNCSYVSRVLRLTLLAPDVIEAILDGRQPDKVTLKALILPFPAEWERQREILRSLPSH
ncbi:hypothetical protein [Microbaculum sp. FT89]|uniref:hypothetical protein n=1 Tax=Microbaculum sp. FT89 TaxID=3447298 RepID=UPI003F52DB27